MDKSKKLIIVIILLVVIIGGVSFYAFHQAKENKEMSELFAVEKLEMENEYTTFATQYDELQIQINNDSLREKLESEKLKTQRLLEELRQVKTSNAAEIMRLKKELKTVRAVLRTYVIQIDSLNKLNQAQRIQHQNSTFQPQLPLIQTMIVSGQQYIKSGFLYSMKIFVRSTERRIPSIRLSSQCHL